MPTLGMSHMLLNRLKDKILQACFYLTQRLTKKELEQEYLERLTAVGELLYETLPNTDEKWQGKTIIEEGRYNYFVLPSGKLPKYSFVMPEIPLYVIVGTIESADWALARMKGVSRKRWEQYQEELSVIRQITPTLATIGKAVAPKIVILTWNDPYTQASLLESFQEALNVVQNSQ